MKAKPMERSSERTLRKPIRCVVIQLARLGDTLQSLMALKAAKQLYPQLEITFIARPGFADAAARVPWIREVVRVPVDEILNPILQGNVPASDRVPQVAKWISPLVKQSWDIVANWSYSAAGSFLCALLPGSVKLGYTRAPDLSGICADDWSLFMQAIVQGNVEQNIHLTDILTTQLLTALQITYGKPQEGLCEPITSKGFFTLQAEGAWNPGGKKWIAIQVDSANKRKDWELANWATLIGLIQKRYPEYYFAILGQSGGPEFFEELKRQAIDERKIISLIGKTDFDLWASVVAKSQWVIAPDTSVIHLASVLGTRVLNLSIGPVEFQETGPYGNGHYVIRPSEPHALRPEAVFGTWSYAEDEWLHLRKTSLHGYFLSQGLENLLECTRVYRSRIRSAAEGGGVTYEAMVRQPLHTREWLSCVIGQIARHWYCGWTSTASQEVSRDLLSPSLLLDLRQLEEGSATLEKIFEEARSTATELATKAGRLRSGRVMALEDQRTLREMSDRLKELDDFVIRIARVQDPFRAFSQMMEVMLHSVQGRSIQELARENAYAYQRLADGIRVFRQWLRHTLDLARPVAVDSTVVSITQRRLHEPAHH